MAAQTLETAGCVDLAGNERPDRAQPVSAGEAFNETDRLRPSRGIAHGIALSIPFWVVIGTILWLLL